MTTTLREVDGELVVFGCRYGVERVRDDVPAYVDGEPMIEVGIEIGDYDDLGEAP